MTRLMCLTFGGEERWKDGPDFTGSHHHDDHHAPDAEHSHHHPADFHPHESPRVMWVPLVILAFFAFACGFLGVAEELTGGAIPNYVHHWLAPVIDSMGRTPAPVTHVEVGEWVLSLVSVGWAGLMMVVACYLYLRKPDLPDQLAAKIAPLYQLSFNKWYWDELWDVHFVRAIKRFNQGLWNVDAEVVDGGVNGTAWVTRGTSTVSGWFDRWVVDLLVNAVAWATKAGSYLIRNIQTGLVQNYMLVMVLGIFFLICIVEWDLLQQLRDLLAGEPLTP
jgi:NADH-quinone oxidoreductase subunit L